MAAPLRIRMPDLYRTLPAGTAAWPELCARYRAPAGDVGRRDGGRTGVVYLLCEKLDGELRIRYVGKTNDMRTRFGHHLAASRREYRDCWLRSCVRRGVEVVPVVLFRAPVEDLAALEQAVIWSGYQLGWELVNQTQGGEGTYGYRPTPEKRAALSAATRRQYAEGRVMVPEVRRRAMQELANRQRAARSATGWSAQTVMIQLIADEAGTGFNRAYATLRLGGVKSGKTTPPDVQRRVWEAYERLGPAVASLRGIVRPTGDTVLLAS